jgi:hypothetical protein
MEDDGWTLETLRVHLVTQISGLQRLLDERYEDQQRAMHAALASAEKAVEKAGVADEKRFESVNEFRGQLADQALTFMTRSEYQAGHQRLQEQVNLLTQQVNAYVTRAENDALHARVDEQVGDLKSRLTRIEGSGEGRGQLVAWAVAAVTIIGTIVIVTNLLLAGK